MSTPVPFRPGPGRRIGGSHTGGLRRGAARRRWETGSPGGIQIRPRVACTVRAIVPTFADRPRRQDGRADRPISSSSAIAGRGLSPDARSPASMDRADPSNRERRQQQRQHRLRPTPLPHELLPLNR